MAFLYSISDHPYLQKLKGDVFSTVFPRAAVPGLAFLGLCLLVMLGATRTVDWYSQTLACSVVAPWLDVLAFLVSLLGNPIITGGVAMVLAVRGWQSRGKLGLMPLLLFVGVAIETVLKFVLPHPGPPPEFSHPLTLPPILHTMIAPFQLHLKTPYSFPSGHMLRTAFLVGLFCAYRPRWRWVGWVVLGAMAGTRLYLNAHWLSDVGGGLLFGLSLAAVAVGIEKSQPVLASRDVSQGIATAPSTNLSS
jgi:membrane-associated phospholipid phosphatase